MMISYKHILKKYYYYVSIDHDLFEITIKLLFGSVIKVMILLNNILDLYISVLTVFPKYNKILLLYV